jgi:hypothetical protein
MDLWSCWRLGRYLHDNGFGFAWIGEKGKKMDWAWKCEKDIAQMAFLGGLFFVLWCFGANLHRVHGVLV